MGIFDKAKDLLNEHNDKVDQGIDKAAEIIDQKTGGEHTEQIRRGCASRPRTRSATPAATHGAEAHTASTGSSRRM